MAITVQGSIVKKDEPKSVIAQAANNVRGQTNNGQTPYSQPNYGPGRINQTLGYMQDLIMGQGQQGGSQTFQFSGPQPFTYNADSDPAYQAALSTARRNIADQQANTNAFLRAGGQGKSSYSETVANQIGAREMSRVSDTVIPQLVQQAYQRYSDQAARDLQLQQMNYGAQQEAERNRINDLANLFARQYQYDVQRPMDEAQLTGVYLPSEAREAVTGSGQQSKQADGIRAQLASLGINPDLYGANVNSAQAPMGIRTLAGQQMDLAKIQAENDIALNWDRMALAKRQANNDAALAWSQLSGHMLYPQQDWTGYQRQVKRGDQPLTLGGMQQQLAQQQQQFNQKQQLFQNQLQERQFNENVRQFGLEYALRQLGQQQQYQMGQDRLALDEARFGYDMATAGNRTTQPNYTMDPKTLVNMLTEQFGVRDKQNPDRPYIPKNMSDTERAEIGRVIASANMSLADKAYVAQLMGVRLPN
ncbi:hypothetical protein J27TS7_58900 [Paenibacillus dendritiformis]|uniref:hypothetical protein n=1 Tax=Paenibacillus dendritiformis TaxID=130049 RepID=UPI001B1FA25F|nr:hypothetical protein [Paenibacillus dendritiformis]GIO76376.1 hypothetical protein J27TS7_58900 [Paenibacillus dendritiformis]